MTSTRNKTACVLAFLLVATLQNVSSAARVNWGNDLKQAAVKSKQSGKPMLITFTASWCHYCHKLIDNTFTNRQLAGKVNEYFIPVVLDADKYEKAVEVLGIEAFPSTLVVSPELKVLGKFTGYYEAPKMTQLLSPYCNKPKKAIAQAIVMNTPEKGSAQPVAAEKPAAQTAFSGMCLVSMLDDRSLVRGKSVITAVYHEVKLHFVSEKHLQVFQAAPAKYWPLADGQCPVASDRREKKTDGAAATAAVYHGQIVLFRSLAHRVAFSEDPRHFAESLKRSRIASRTDATERPATMFR